MTLNVTVQRDTLRTAGIPLLVAAAVVGGTTVAHADDRPSTDSSTGSDAGSGGSTARTAPNARLLGSGNGLSVRRLRARPVVHVVRRGDTVWAIAHRFRVPVHTVIQANNLDASALIRPGQKLLLPGAKAVRTPARLVSAGNTVTRRRPHPFQHAVAAPQPAVAPPPRTYPSGVRAAAAANRAALAARRVPSRSQVRQLVTKTAERYRLDPALALAIATMESGFDQRQVSGANAIGTMQVLPSTGAWISQLVGRRLDLLDAEDNVTAGVVLLTVLQAQAADQATAIAGYYQGLGSVRRHGMYPDTRRYVASVRALAARVRSS